MTKSRKISKEEKLDMSLATTALGCAVYQLSGNPVAAVTKIPRISR